MGRAPCCDKASVKKGPWSPEEDLKLKLYIEKHGTGGNWISLPQRAGLRRCGKSCRLRWLNYLRPDIKHGEFTDDEDRLICTIYASIGSRWSIIAAQLPGRTDNDIKNYWNTKLKKKLITIMPMHLPPPSSSQKKLHQTPTCNKNNFYYYLTNIDQTPSISIPQIHQSSKAQKSATGLIQNGYQMKDNMLSFGGGGGDHQASCCTSSDGSSTITTAEPMGRNYIGQVCITSPSSAQTYHQGIRRDFYNNSGDVNYVWNEEKPNRLWESNVDDQTPIVDYGFEEIKQLISTNNMCDDFLVDNEYITDEDFMYH